MSVTNNLGDFLTNLANAIRTKKGTSSAINAQSFANEIAAIETGTDTSDATASASDILSGKTAYGSSGLITGSISSKAAATYTPSTANQSIAAGQYLSGAQTISGDSNLVASNIKSGVSIFGVSGTYPLSVPTLNAPSLSISGSTLTITQSANNGNFASGFRVYNGATLIATTSGTTVDLSSYITAAGSYTITAKAYGTNFNDSAASNEVTYQIIVKLATPVVSISGSIINWELIPNASGYLISYAGAASGTQSVSAGTSSCDLEGLLATSGTYNTVTVTAKGTGYYTNSDPSNAVTYTTKEQLLAPVIHLTGSILAWTMLDNGAGYTIVYSIRSNGVEAATTTGMSKDLSMILTDAGTYAMTVVATAVGYRDSEPSNAVTYQIIETLADKTWGQIADAAEAGIAGSIWAVGDEKDVTLTTGETITLRILGFNHDTKTAGGTAGITFGMKNLLAANYYMNSSNTTVGGWGSSDMHNTTMATLYALLPQELQAVIKPVNKLTSAGNTSSTINTTSDSLFLLSEIEVFGAPNNSYTGEGSQYAWFAAHDTTAERKKYLSNGTGSILAWWLRSPTNYSGYTTDSFCCVTSTGHGSPMFASAARGVALSFCV